MSKSVWVVAKRIWCDRVQGEVDLLEERVYPLEVLPDVSSPFQVRSRKCEKGVDCNLDGYRCRWSGLNPDYDPFAE